MLKKLLRFYFFAAISTHNQTESHNGTLFGEYVTAQMAENFTTVP